MLCSTYLFLKPFHRWWARICALHIRLSIYQCSFLIYSYFTLCTNHIPAAMATFTENDRIRIPKLKEAENYRPWAIDVQVALESRGVLFSVPRLHDAPESNSEKSIKDVYLEYSQKDASAKGILILSIDPLILTDKCTTNRAKEICDYYSTQYKEKRFVLRFTLFVHLTTSKVSSFRSITAYNADFQITLDKFRSLGDSIPDDL